MDVDRLAQIKTRVERVQIKKHGRAINEIERIDLDVHAVEDLAYLIAEVERLQTHIEQVDAALLEVQGELHQHRLRLVQAALTGVDIGLGLARGK